MPVKSTSKPKLDLRVLPPSALLSIRESARYLHVSPTKMYSLIYSGRVKVCDLDGRPRIAVSDLEAFTARLKACEGLCHLSNQSLDGLR
jgi:Helix-turn-helix domain